VYSAGSDTTAGGFWLLTVFVRRDGIFRTGYETHSCIAIAT
jgi:hypothetical protein